MHPSKSSFDFFLNSVVEGVAAVVGNHYCYCCQTLGTALAVEGAVAGYHDRALFLGEWELASGWGWSAVGRLATDELGGNTWAVVPSGVAC